MSSPSPYSIKDRLRRSSSTRTIRRGHRMAAPPLYPEPFDADAGRYQATLAASLAMRRSAERSSTESRCSYDSLGGPSSMAVPQRIPQRADYTADSEIVPLHRSMACQEESLDEKIPSAVLLPPITEFGSGLDGPTASLPSSYRRLRKTRSMFAPRQRLSRTFYGQSPVLSPYSENERELSHATPRKFRPVRRSLSFLRGDNSASAALQHPRSQDIAAQLARAEFEQNCGQDFQSSIFTLKPGRECKPFRKTFRTTSASGIDARSTPPSVERYRNPSSFGRARSFSSSIKRGIKRVLGWSKPPVDPAEFETSPSQPHNQDAPSSAYGQTVVTSPASFNCTKSLHVNEKIEPIPSAVVRNIHSFESLASSSSRVTSWSDSTTANTATVRMSGERKHLPSIDENEDTCSNSSQYLTSSSQSKLPSTPSRARPRGSIDSQRLYTALMRKIGRANTRGSDEEIIFGEVKEHRAIPTWASSLRPRSSRQTVRQVPSDESITSLRSFATARVGMGTPQRPRSIFGTKQIFDDETKCANIAQTRELESSSDSPSAYSRTTSGNSPPATNKEGDTERLDSDDEPGVATIFESQRTTYISPKRDLQRSGDTPIKPSVDWQQWVSSQMERIESVVPVRDHYREDAQIHAEESDEPSDKLSETAWDYRDCLDRDQEIPFNTPLSTEMLKSSRVVTSSNFSRPFNRSSSVRTITTLREEAGDTPRVPATCASISPIPTSYPGQAAFSVSRTRPRSNVTTTLPMQSRSTNRLPVPESPTPKRSPGATHLRLARYGNNSARWSPSGVQESTALSLRFARASRDISKLTNENLKNEEMQGDLKEIYSQARVTNSPMSSKRMVEIFLKSRRQHMGSEASEGGVSDDAFI